MFIRARSPVTVSRPPPSHLPLFHWWSQREPNTTTTRHVSASKGCRGIFNIRGRPLRFRFFTLGRAPPIPFFRLRGRPRVMRIEILSPCSIETNFADVWTLSGESWSVRKDTWTSFSKTLKRGNNFSVVRAN